MSARNAQLFEPAFARPDSEAWRKQRLELVQPLEAKRARRLRRELFGYVLVVMLLFAAAFAYMSFEARIGVAGREVNNLQLQIAEVRNLSRRTELEIGSLSSLERVENFARLQLGMVYPELGSAQYLSPEISSQIAHELTALETQETSLVAAESEGAEPGGAEQAAAVATSAPLMTEAETEQPKILTAWSQWLGNFINDQALAAEDAE